MGQRRRNALLLAEERELYTAYVEMYVTKGPKMTSFKGTT